MKVAIIEDEERAANRLKQLLADSNEQVEICAEFETVKEVIAFNWKESTIELIFLDIHLADGSSFEIFKHIRIDLPIIFTTAYDQYALEAFEVNSVDYLLKPIDGDKLGKAIEKWQKWQHPKPVLDSSQMDKLLAQISDRKEYLKNLLVAHKHQLIPVPVEEFAFFYIDNGVVRGVTFDEKQYFPDQNLDELEEILNPALFYRASRQVIIHQKSIVGIESYFNSRLLVKTNPAYIEDLLVSKAKARNFKNWVKGL